MFNFIEDITGIEDFDSLEMLSAYNLNFQSSSPTNMILNLTSVQTLETLNLYVGDDAISIFINGIDLSNNLSISTINATGIWPLKLIDLKTSSTDVSNLNINISIAPLDLTSQSLSIEDLFCIKVTDENAAVAGNGVYSTWTITANNNPYYFSEICTLSKRGFKENEVSIYPNPVNNIVFISNNLAKLTNVEVYNSIEQLVFKTKEFVNNAIDISSLDSSLYLMKIETKNGHVVKKIVKN